MKPVITPAESGRLDALGDVDALMERAGWAIYRAATEMGAGYGTRVVVLAGPGNNGGDGLVAARHLRHRGVAVSVQLLAEPRTGPAARALLRARAAGVPVSPVTAPSRADLVIDALFGGGFRGELPAEIQAWADSPSRVLAVDVPSGLDPLTGSASEVCFRAERTVTFHALRTGHVLGAGPDRCGVVVVADIGQAGEQPMFLLAEDSDAPRPGRNRSAHKWSAGSVLVVGGGPGMVGAAILAGRSALTFGAGAVGVATPDPAIVQTAAPELLAYGLDSPPGRYRVLVVGPGLGAHAAEVVPSLLEDPRAMVFDADALGVLTPELLSVRGGPSVVTPHDDEFRRLTREDPSPHAAGALARTTGGVVLLKGNPTIVTDGGASWLVRSGGPELATIGTGDVLAGMIAALIARGLPALDAALSAAYWHGVAAADLRRSGTVTAEMLSVHIRGFAWDDES